MQTLMFVLVGTGVPAVTEQRPGDACGGAPGDHRGLIQVVLVGYGG
jgi:hypothetical protein